MFSPLLSSCPNHLRVLVAHIALRILAAIHKYWQGKRYHNSEPRPEWLQEHLHHYLSQCHGSSCCARRGGTSANVLPRSGIAVGTYGAVSLSCSDTSKQLRSKWVECQGPVSPGEIREGSRDSTSNQLCVFFLCLREFEISFIDGQDR